MYMEIFLLFFVPFLFTYALMIGLGFLEIQILKHTFTVKDFILVIFLKIFEIFFIFSDKINIKSLKSIFKKIVLKLLYCHFIASISSTDLQFSNLIESTPNFSNILSFLFINSVRTFIS